MMIRCSAIVVHNTLFKVEGFVPVVVISQSQISWLWGAFKILLVKRKLTFLFWFVCVYLSFTEKHRC